MSRMQRIDVPDFETIWPRLQPQVEQLAERQEARRGSSGSQALKVISMLLGLILAFIGLFSLLKGNLFGLVLFAVGALLVLAPLRWLKNYLTESRYLVTPELMVALNELIERLGTKHVAVSFSQSRMFIAAVLDRNYFSLDSVQSLNDGKAEVKEIYEDLVYFLSLVEHFNLNTRIWSKV